MNFLMSLGIFGIVWGLILVLFVVCSSDTTRKICAVIICVAFWLLMSIFTHSNVSTKLEVWNDGYCECGTHWELVDVVTYKNGGTVKYYSCPECYAEIEQ